jgi:2-oxoglutarate ferredoxin oxidoreductase subunit alpha
MLTLSPSFTGKYARSHKIPRPTRFFPFCSKAGIFTFAREHTIILIAVTVRNNRQGMGDQVPGKSQQEGKNHQDQRLCSPLCECQRHRFGVGERAVYQGGIPHGRARYAENIFPSNIQGLPTWYEVRVSEKGHLGRREGVDLMIAVNPQSMKKDYADVRGGGYFLYDSSKPLPPGYDRTDITHIGIPLMNLCNAEFTDARQRQLFKNIVYIGALVALFKIEFAVIEELIGQQFKGKEKLIEPNIKALKMGENWVLDNLHSDFDLRIERRDLLGDKILYSGNSACGLGAIYAGATVAAWYPITPSTSVVDAFAKYASKYRVDAETAKNNYAIVQAEDELAAIGMVMGASWNGARAFTATSGPGVSLMNEFLGLGYFAEVPTVLIDVQRTGPSTGMPTRTQQSDIYWQPMLRTAILSIRCCFRHHRRSVSR